MSSRLTAQPLFFFAADVYHVYNSIDTLQHIAFRIALPDLQCLVWFCFSHGELLPPDVHINYTFYFILLERELSFFCVCVSGALTASILYILKKPNGFDILNYFHTTSPDFDTTSPDFDNLANLLVERRRSLFPHRRRHCRGRVSFSE